MKSYLCSQEWREFAAEERRLALLEKESRINRCLYTCGCCGKQSTTHAGCDCKVKLTWKR